ncbi:MAG: extracellular solute-binding protein [Clostridiales bacterium]|nr:extracellular solute-binding protein [Clostridiales bacterium]
MKKRKCEKRSKALRVIALATVLALTAGAVGGCAGGKDKDAQGRTRVSVVWPQKEGPSLDKMEARKVTYEENNPDAVIERDSWQFDLKTFYAKAAGGQLPTVYDTNFTEIPQIIASEYSADLTDVLKKRGYEGKLSDKVLEVISRDGKIYALPYTAYVLGLGYNTEMFEAAGLMEPDGTPKQPKDWNEVAEFAQKIKAATGKPGFVFPTANNNGGWIFTSLAWSFGAEFVKQDADGNWQAAFNSPEAAEALQYIKDLKWKYDVLPSNILVDDKEYYKTFATGNAGMIITAGDYPRKVVQYDMQPEQSGIMAIPAGPKRHVTLMGGGVCCIAPNSTEDQIDAAVRWIEMTTNFNATDEYKDSVKKDIEIKLGENQLIGIKDMSIWSADTEAVEYRNGLIDKNANINTNHVKLYNEFVENMPCEVQAEVPVCAQELYGILDNCIQEVLNNENADCAQLLESAASEYQTNYLNNIDY